MKKLEQQVDDHRQYRTAHQRCGAWLKGATEKLAACGDTSGDKESIQAQLENLHVSLDNLKIDNFQPHSHIQ